MADSVTTLPGENGAAALSARGFHSPAYWLLLDDGITSPCHWRFRLLACDGSVADTAIDEEPGAHRDQLALIAALRGLEALDEPSHVIVLTSNRYVWHGFTYGLDEWRDNGWRWEAFGVFVPVRYLEIWRRVDRLCSIHRVECRMARRELLADAESAGPPSRMLGGSPSSKLRPRARFTARDDGPPDSSTRRTARDLELQTA